MKKSINFLGAVILLIIAVAIFVDLYPEYKNLGDMKTDELIILAFFSFWWICALIGSIVIIRNLLKKNKNKAG